MLHARIEEALDRAEIAIVPVPPKKGEPVEWRLTVDQSAHKTAGKFRTQLVEPPSDNFDSASTIGL